MPRQKDSLTLTGCLRFTDECLAARLPLSILFELFAEIAILCWEEPSLRKEPILIREFFLHLVEVACQVIFPRKSVHSRKMIYSLEGLHLVQPINSATVICPEQIPLLFVIRLLLEASKV